MCDPSILGSNGAALGVPQPIGRDNAPRHAPKFLRGFGHGPSRRHARIVNVSDTPCRFIDSGGVYKLAFGPKAFIVVSDPVVVRHLLKVRALLAL